MTDNRDYASVFLTAYLGQIRTVMAATAERCGEPTVLIVGEKMLVGRLVGMMASVTIILDRPNLQYSLVQFADKDAWAEGVAVGITHVSVLTDYARGEGESKDLIDMLAKMSDFAMEVANTGRDPVVGITPSGIELMQISRVDV